MPGIAFGTTRTGKINLDPYWCVAVCSPVGTAVRDGSKLICKAGGVAWFVAPASTQLGGKWGNGCFDGSNPIGLGNQRCCVSEWGTLDACLSKTICNYRANEWFVPSFAQLDNPGYSCRTNWDSFCNVCYWSSSEASYYCFGTQADGCSGCSFSFNPSFPGPVTNIKCTSNCIRAFRCLTY